MATQTDRIAIMEKSKRRNHFAVIGGAGATLVATVVFLFLPSAIPLQGLKALYLETTGGWLYGNPFQQFRLLGPAVGGLAGGYLAVNINGRHTWTTSMKYGCFAAVAGVGLVYVTYVGLVAIRYTSAILTDPAIDATIPHLLDIFLVPMFFALPLLPIAIFEGLLAGAAGKGLRTVRLGLSSA